MPLRHRLAGAAGSPVCDGVDPRGSRSRRSLCSDRGKDLGCQPSDEGAALCRPIARAEMRRRHQTETPLRWQTTPDGRSRGTFTQFVRDHVAMHPEGSSIEDLIEAVEKDGKVFRLPGSRRGMHAAIARLVQAREVVEDGGRLLPARIRARSRSESR